MIARVGKDAALEALGERIRPLTLARDQVLPVAAPFEALLPWAGLRRGGTVSVTAAGVGGGTSLALALVAEASRAGSWMAAVGLPSLGLVAADEAGVALERLVLVPAPERAAWGWVVAALVDGFDLLLLHAGRGGVRSVDARKLVARARERGTVLVQLGPGWDGGGRPLPADRRGPLGGPRRRLRPPAGPAGHPRGHRPGSGRPPPPGRALAARRATARSPPSTRSAQPPSSRPRSVRCGRWAEVAGGAHAGGALRRLAGGGGRALARTSPVAVVHANRVVATSPAARAEGVARHQRRREAQGRCPALVVVEQDLARDARAFEPVVAALDALTPRVELTRPGPGRLPHPRAVALLRRRRRRWWSGPSAWWARRWPSWPPVRWPCGPGWPTGPSPPGWPPAPPRSRPDRRASSNPAAPRPSSPSCPSPRSSGPTLVDVLGPARPAPPGRPRRPPRPRRAGPLRHRRAHRVAPGRRPRRAAAGHRAAARPTSRVSAELDPPADTVAPAAFLARGMAEELSPPALGPGLGLHPRGDRRRDRARRAARAGVAGGGRAHRVGDGRPAALAARRLAPGLGPPPAHRGDHPAVAGARRGGARPAAGSSGSGAPTWPPPTGRPGPWPGSRACSARGRSPCPSGGAAATRPAQVALVDAAAVDLTVERPGAGRIPRGGPVAGAAARAVTGPGAGRAAGRRAGRRRRLVAAGQRPRRGVGGAGPAVGGRWPVAGGGGLGRAVAARGALVGPRQRPPPGPLPGGHRRRHRLAGGARGRRLARSRPPTTDGRLRGLRRCPLVAERTAAPGRRSRRRRSPPTRRTRRGTSDSATTRPRNGAPRPLARSKKSENVPTAWLRWSSGTSATTAENSAGNSSDMPTA